MREADLQMSRRRFLVTSAGVSAALVVGPDVFDMLDRMGPRRLMVPGSALPGAPLVIEKAPALLTTRFSGMRLMSYQMETSTGRVTMNFAAANIYDSGLVHKTRERRPFRSGVGMAPDGVKRDGIKDVTVQNHMRAVPIIGSREPVMIRTAPLGVSVDAEINSPFVREMLDAFHADDRPLTFTIEHEYKA